MAFCPWRSQMGSRYGSTPPSQFGEALAQLRLRFQVLAEWQDLLDNAVRFSLCVGKRSLLRPRLAHIDSKGRKYCCQMTLAMALRLRIPQLMQPRAQAKVTLAFQRQGALQA